MKASLFAWIGNTDGVRAASPSASSPNAPSLIANCFFKVGDDSIKLFSSNLRVTDCTIWQLNNAAPFEFGVTQYSDQSDIMVRNCHVIRTENVFPTLSNAVFSSALGGNANLSNYTFENIDVENSNFHLFKLVLIPNQYTKPGNDNLGSLDDIKFRNIKVSDAQMLPDLFQSFDLVHQITNVTFDKVTVAGQQSPDPAITFNVNRRHLALAGTAFSGLLWRSQSNPENFQISLFSGIAANPSSTLYTNQSNLPATMQVRTMGEFFGDGYASVVLFNTLNSEWGLWKEPVLTFGEPWSNQYVPITIAGSGAKLQVDGELAGVGDFNGDGYSDLVTWHAKTQTGKILLMKGAQVISEIPYQPYEPSSWKVNGFGDFNQSGYSDILLRDDNGNIEILYFDANGFNGSADFTSSNFFYNSTNYYNNQYPPASGHFDTSWNIVGVRDFTGTGYAEILWNNPTTNQVGITTFGPNQTKVFSGRVFAKIPTGDEIQALGDFNGDGAADMLIRNLTTGQSTIWYSGYFGSNLYGPGPTLSPGPSLDWTIQVNKSSGRRP